MAGATVIRHTGINTLGGAELAALRQALAAVFPAIDAASVLELRFWREGQEQRPVAQAAYRATVTLEQLRDAVDAKEQMMIESVTV